MLVNCKKATCNGLIIGVDKFNDKNLEQLLKTSSLLKEVVNSQEGLKIYFTNESDSIAQGCVRHPETHNYILKNINHIYKVNDKIEEFKSEHAPQKNRP